MASDRQYNFPAYITWFSLSVISFVMLAGCYDLFVFVLTVIARLAQ